MCAVDGGPVLIEGGELSCARLLVLLRARIRDLPAGTLVHLETTDPVAPIDLAAWCRMTGHVYLGVVAGSFPAPRYAIEVADSPRPTHPDSPWRPH